jgi:large subunit ribosomal protein L35
MPKQKTHSGAKKRFKVTGTGKIMQKSARRQHLMRKKTTKQKRHMSIDGVLAPGEQTRVAELLQQHRP